MHINKVFDNNLLNYGTTIHENFETTIAQNGFFEKRNAKIQFPYLEVTVDASDRTLRAAAELNEFYKEMKGRLNTFNFKHPFNFSTNGVAQATPFDSIVLESGPISSDDVPLKIQAKERSGKNINVVKYGTLMISLKNYIYIDDYENRHEEIEDLYPSYSIIDIENTMDISEMDYETGQFNITRYYEFLDTEDFVVSMGCEFYYKVRFDTDILSINHSGFEIADCDSFALVEVKR